MVVGDYRYAHRALRFAFAFARWTRYAHRRVCRTTLACLVRAPRLRCRSSSLFYLRHLHNTRRAPAFLLTYASLRTHGYLRATHTAHTTAGSCNTHAPHRFCAAVWRTAARCARCGFVPGRTTTPAATFVAACDCCGMPAAACVHCAFHHRHCCHGLLLMQVDWRHVLMITVRTRISDVRTVRWTWVWTVA